MHGNSLILTLFLIFAGAALLATAALYTRQSLLVAYILIGAILGPWGLKLVSNSALIEQTGDIGIIFLLFLLGLHLQPQSLIKTLKEVSWVAIISSLLFFAAGYLIGYLFGYSTTECIVIGAAMMFSSTIIGLKLLPTTVLHHRHTGEVMIGILLMQDLFAILVLIVLHGATIGELNLWKIAGVGLTLPGLLLLAYVCEKFILIKLIAKFDRILEYMFLIAIGWCLGMAELANILGLSYEVGAFIAGVSLAANPIAQFIAESLKPVRDFFLVLFFFTVGASFNLTYLPHIIIPALILAALILFAKPFIFKILLQQMHEAKDMAWEIGVRLGQASEFSLLVAYLAANTSLITSSGSYLIQGATIITFIVSSYWVVLRYPTPVAVSNKLRRD